ncbi:MAG: PhoH family protein [Clostridiales bacterium]|nr:PhoH family protein [Clostridiales bacterium]
MVESNNSVVERISTKGIHSLLSVNRTSLSSLEEVLSVQLQTDQNAVVITGDKTHIIHAKEVLSAIDEVVSVTDDMDTHAIRYLAELGDPSEIKKFAADYAKAFYVTPKGYSVRCKTIGQKIYTDAIQNNEVVLCVGPAGSGKTYLGVASAVMAFQKKQVSRIVLTRPAVEAGERLGFLPGDLQEKVDPYMRPIYDALQELLGAEAYQRYYEKGLIEVSPLAFMRGRTLDDSFILLDEAQNTTIDQMIMFLTRIGMNSKACVCGDITQIDLPNGVQNGLSDAIDVLKGIDHIEAVYLSGADIVRNPIVQKIVRAYHRQHSEGGRAENDRKQ